MLHSHKTIVNTNKRNLIIEKYSSFHEKKIIMLENPIIASLNKKSVYSVSSKRVQIKFSFFLLPLDSLKNLTPDLISKSLITEKFIRYIG